MSFGFKAEKKVKKAKKAEHFDTPTHNVSN